MTLARTVFFSTSSNALATVLASYCSLNCCDCFALGAFDAFVAFAAALAPVDDGLQRRLGDPLDARQQFGVGRLREHDVDLRLANLSHDLVLEADDLDVVLLGPMRSASRTISSLTSFRPGLDHDDGVAAARDRQVELAGGELLEGGVHDEFAVHVAHAGRGDGAVERDLGDGERDGRADDAEDVRLVLVVGGEDGRDDLHLVPHPLGEARAQRAVGQPRSECRLGGRSAFAAEKAAGDAADGVEALFVLDGEREEVQPFANASQHCGDEHNGVAVAHNC